METEKTNGVASAEDFRRLAEAEAFGQPDRVILPGSGLAVIIRRPTLMYFRVRRTNWPEDLVEKMEARTLGAKLEFTPEEQLFLFRQDTELFKEAFVKPGLSLTPGPDEINPNWLLEKDVDFLRRYLGGQVLADGTELATFPGSESRDSGDGGDPGGEVRAAADDVSAGSRSGLGD